MKDFFDTIIVGAGAAGLAAACSLRGKTLLLEKEERVGRKLAATGNGRCNLLNLGEYHNRYHGGGQSAAEAILQKVTPLDILHFFESLGLICREEKEGRVYPQCGNASAVVDVLRYGCFRKGVNVSCSENVLDLQADKNEFIVKTSHSIYRSHFLIAATGGAAAASLSGSTVFLEQLRIMGHKVTSLRPSLTPLRLLPGSVRGLKGVRVFCTLTLMDGDDAVQTEEGEALFSDNGISGIAAMQLSRAAGMLLSRRKKPIIRIQLLPQVSLSNIQKRLEVLWTGSTAEHLLTGIVHKQIAMRLLDQIKISPSTVVTKEIIENIIPYLTDWRIPVVGIESFERAQVMAGGLDIANFNPDTLESLVCPGLFVCGEALDVDGDCGGFNLMWAWASGILAAQNIAMKVTEESNDSVAWDSCRTECFRK